MVNHSTIITDRPNRAPTPRRHDFTHTLWQWFGSTTMLSIAGVLSVLLFLGATLIQQMPGQIADDPAAATRWLLTVGEEYGVWGNVLRTLGLFDVLHNPVLQLLLTIIALIILIQLGSNIAGLWRFWHIAQQLTTPGTTAGLPIPLPSTQPLYRLRQAVVHLPAALATLLTQKLRPQFDEVISTTASITAPPNAIVETQASNTSEMPAAAADDAMPATEWRLLARRHYLPWIWLQPLFYCGLLLALAGIWIILLAGWEITPPPLVPGEQYRATTQRVTLSYTVLEHGDALAPTLGVELADTSQQVPLGESRQLQLGQVTLQANAGPPALWIRSKEAAVTLSRPGQAQNVMDLGLIFPTVGSEDSVVVENRVGLRIVRVAVLPEAVKANASDNNHTTDSPLGTAPHEQFLVEVYQPDEAKPVQTIVVSGPATAKIQVSGKVRELRFVPMSSMAAAIYYRPAIWLLWVALGFVVVGLVGYCYRPTFLLLQLAPWPTARTVVVAQSDVAADLERLRPALK